MPKITRITRQNANREKLSIYIDNQFCTGIRERTFKGMNLQVGSEITCEDLVKQENFFWKQAYGIEAWQKEKVRIIAVKKIFSTISNRLIVTTVGFGADTDELIERHPDEKGKPDLNVSLIENPDNVILKVEVTGTERKRGTDYWVRPDKLLYAENHPEEDVWIVLHYALPKEEIIFIKPIANKKYPIKVITIREADEHMCVFNNGEEEVKSLEEFKTYLAEKFNVV